MLHVSIIFELLRSQPRMVFWLMTLTQATLWWLIPSLLYSAPPGDLPLLLAVGHEFQVGTFLGPPLASWLAEIAFTLGGMPAVYLLSQICVVGTYCAVFTLGRAIVGEMHATLAVMLMIGVAVFSVPTPEFSPSVLALPITALTILHFWRALGEGRRGYWPVVAVDIGLLLLTSYAGLILCVALIAFILGTARGRKTLTTIDPWIAGVIVLILMFPHLIWLDAADEMWLPTFTRLLGTVIADADPFDWLRMLLRTALLHGGFLVLIALASGWRLRQLRRVPVFLRSPVSPFARQFIYYFAFVPFLSASIISVIFGERTLFGGTAPLVVLFGLAAIVVAGDIINLHRQRLVGVVWGALLIIPPFLNVLGMFALPWITGADFQVTQPAAEIGRYFSENFARRTGKPLEIVAGDPRVATLVALYSQPRASLYLDAIPAQSPWVTPQDVARKGAVVVWIATDAAGAPPPEISARFPTLVPDVRRAFDRTVQGRTPLLRIGWGIVRPQQ
jgi:hypothetical protein